MTIISEWNLPSLSILFIHQRTNDLRCVLEIFKKPFCSIPKLCLFSEFNNAFDSVYIVYFNRLLKPDFFAFANASFPSVNPSRIWLEYVGSARQGMCKKFILFNWVNTNSKLSDSVFKVPLRWKFWSLVLTYFLTECLFRPCLLAVYKEKGVVVSQLRPKSITSKYALKNEIWEIGLDDIFVKPFSPSWFKKIA